MVRDYYNKYKNSLRGNMTEILISSNKETIINNFEQSLFAESIFINGIDEYRVIVKQGKTSDDKKLLFEPDTKIDIGSVVLSNNNSYLIMDFQGEGINEVYPSATLKLCNSTYPIKANKTRVLIGNNPKTGEPIYDWQEGTPTNIPCIVETSFTNTADNSQLPLPQGQMIVTLQYKSDLGIKVNDEFVMYGNQYKISSLDQTKIINDKGILKIIAKEV